MGSLLLKSLTIRKTTFKLFVITTFFFFPSFNRQVPLGCAIPARHCRNHDWAFTLWLTKFYEPVDKGKSRRASCDSCRQRSFFLTIQGLQGLLNIQNISKKDIYWRFTNSRRSAVNNVSRPSGSPIWLFIHYEIFSAS